MFFLVSKCTPTGEHVEIDGIRRMCVVIKYDIHPKQVESGPLPDVPDQTNHLWMTRCERGLGRRVVNVLLKKFRIIV